MDHNTEPVLGTLLRENGLDIAVWKNNDQTFTAGVTIDPKVQVSSRTAFIAFFAQFRKRGSTQPSAISELIWYLEENLPAFEVAIDLFYLQGNLITPHR